MRDAKPPPTVIVARRVAPGRDADAERWLRKLTTQAAVAPGYVEANMQPPNAQHPDEWVIVYRFESASTLDDWLTSPRRVALLDEGVDMFVGPAREQVVALADETRSVTAVASFRLSPDNESAFDARFADLQSALAQFDGFIRSELVRPVPGTQDDTVVVFSFTSRERLDEWLDSDVRREVLAEIDPLLDGPRTVNVVGGFAGWFATRGSATPKRWKQAALVLLALYPTALLVGLVRDALFPDLTMPLAVLLGNVAGVAVLSWVLMPFLTRAFDRWLRH